MFTDTKSRESTEGRNFMAKYLVTTRKEDDFGNIIRDNLIVSFIGEFPTEDEIDKLIKETDSIITFMQRLIAKGED